MQAPTKAYLTTRVNELEEQAAMMRRIIRDIAWMAQRYCDDRSSYSGHMFNQALDLAVELEILVHTEVPYARDAMFGTWNPVTGGWNCEQVVTDTVVIASPTSEFNYDVDTHGDDDEGCNE